MPVYVIKPLEKKSIVYHVEMYRHNENGTISWFNLDETFRWGQGFIEENLDCNLPYEDSNVVYAKSEPGWGCEFDDSINIELEFSEDITEEEQEAIRKSYYEGGAGWLFDGDHAWQDEDTSILVYAPFQVSLCEDDGTIIEENVKLAKRPANVEIAASTAVWPFPSENLG